MFKSIFRTATFKQSQITILGTIINGALGAVFYILLARFLGPENFGFLIVSIVILTLISDISDFGTNTGLVKYVSQSLLSNEKEALKFLKLSLEFKILIWAVVFGVGFFISPLVAQNIFHKDELTYPLRLVMLGVGGALLFSFATSALQAFQKYFVWSLINILTNFLRLLFIIILIYLSKLNLYSSLLSFILFPFIGFFLALLFLPIKKVIVQRNEFAVAKKLFNYNVRVGIFTLIAAVSARLDTFLTARLLSPFEIGIYGAANQLVSVVPQLVSALGLVAAPKFASFTNKFDMVIYLKKLQLFVLGLSALGLLAIPVSFYLIPQFFGSEYSAAIMPFAILLLAMLIFLISVPVHNSVIFYFGKPDVFIWVSIGHLIIIGSLGFFMISQFGVIGAATTVLVGTIFNLLVPLGWLLYKINK